MFSSFGLGGIDRSFPLSYFMTNMTKERKQARPSRRLNGTILDSAQEVYYELTPALILRSVFLKEGNFDHTNVLPLADNNHDGSDEADN